jgi:ATP-binding cassette subfamily C protein
VLPSRSIPTLVALALLAALLFLFQGLLDLLRARLLVRIGQSVDEAVSARVYSAVVRLPLRKPSRGDGLYPLRDLDSIRGFLSGPGPSAMFDLPWLPLYVGICYLFHPLIGLVAAFGAGLLVVFTLITDAVSHSAVARAHADGMQRNALADASRRNAEVLHAMGMSAPLLATWQRANSSFLRNHQRAADITNGLGAMSKSFRMLLQSAVLGVGALLVIRGEASAGIIIAGSILAARALAPVEMAIANWKSFAAARQGWRRLREVLDQFPPEDEPIALPQPRLSLQAEALTAIPPGGRTPVVHDVSFVVTAGQALGIIGPTASGKSSLVRLLVGVWAPVKGKVRLDGAALEHWAPAARGKHVGYLPQDVELFDGTVAQNIARFQPDAEARDIIAAGRAAGIHEMVLRLPEGYETRIGEGGAALSGGQRQRVALARALYRDPFLIVLDEPNSNLDADGEQALMKAIQSVRERGGIVILVAHRPSILQALDQLLIMADGKVQTHGPRDQVLAALAARRPAAPRPLRVAE